MAARADADRHELAVMAGFVLSVPGMTPAIYWSTPSDELEAIAVESKRRADEAKKERAKSKRRRR